MWSTIIHPRLFSRRFSALVMAVFLSLFCFEVAKTDDRGGFGFTNESLRGSYALRGTGGANNAASIGITRFDGNGNASRSLLLNEATPPNGRQVIRITAVGNYEVNPDGTGTAVFVNTLPDNSIVTFNFDFVITKARPGGPKGSHLAKALFMVQREPGIAAQLVTFELTRLPN